MGRHIENGNIQKINHIAMLHDEFKGSFGCLKILRGGAEQKINIACDPCSLKALERGRRDRQIDPLYRLSRTAWSPDSNPSFNIRQPERFKASQKSGSLRSWLFGQSHTTARREDALTGS